MLQEELEHPTGLFDCRRCENIQQAHIGPPSTDALRIASVMSGQPAPIEYNLNLD